MNKLVSQIVGQFLDLQNLGKAEYAKAYRIAVRGWRQLNWDITGQVRTVLLNVSTDRTLPLPEDFINDLDFGTDNGNGGISSFTRVDNFPSKYSRTGAVVTDKLSHTMDFYPWGYPESESYGVGSSNTIGFYYINKAERKIYVDPNYGGSELKLKYLSKSTVGCDDYEINEMAEEALITWIDWQFAKGDRRLGLAEKRDKERMFYTEKAKAKMRIKKITRADMNQNSRESVKMGLGS